MGKLTPFLVVALLSYLSGLSAGEIVLTLLVMLVLWGIGVVASRRDVPANR